MILLVYSSNILLWFLCRFIFEVEVKISNEEVANICDKKIFLLRGEQERDHASAKDSAAYKMLRELQKHGLCFIKTFNNDSENI